MDSLAELVGESAAIDAVRVSESGRLRQGRRPPGWRPPPECIDVGCPLFSIADTKLRD